MPGSVQEFADQLVGQLQNMRMGGMGGMSKSDVSGMAESATGSAAQKLTDLAENFDTADTDRDGNVSVQDLMATYGAFARDGQASSSTLSVVA